MANVGDLSNRIKGRCPSCDCSLDFRQLGAEMFRRVFAALKDGVEVRVPGFGIFRPVVVESMRVPHGRERIEVGRRVVIKFRAYQSARDALNEGPQTRRNERRKRRSR